MLSLEADGSAMYTIQALWTQARESLDVTTVILNNRSYAILNIELARIGAGAGGPKARDLLDLSRPDLDFVHARRAGWACPPSPCARRRGGRRAGAGDRRARAAPHRGPARARASHASGGASASDSAGDDDARR